MSRKKDDTRPMRRVLPLGFRVLIQIKELDDVTDGGLYLPVELPRFSDSDLAGATSIAAVGERILRPFFVGSTHHVPAMA